MPLLSTTQPAGLITQYQKYFSKKLLDHAVQELILNQFAEMAELPRNVGAKTVRFFRRVKASAGNVQTLTEGAPINVFTDVTYDTIDVALTQYGEAIKITDILSMTDLFNSLKNGIELMGEDAALQADGITRNTIVSGLSGVAGSDRYSQGVANWAALAAASPAAARFVGTDALDAATRLKVNRAPQVNGDYVAICPPQVTRDMMQDPEWLKAKEYSDVKELFKGEVGRFYGVRFVETTNPWMESSTGANGTYSASGDIFTTVVTGKGAYGVVKLDGDSPMSPQVLISDKPDKSDILNQFVAAGWKAYYGAELLNPAWAQTIRSKTQFTN